MIFYFKSRFDKLTSTTFRECTDLFDEFPKI